MVLKNGHKRRIVNALLDDASTKTYLNVAVAAELGLQGIPQKVTVNVLNNKVDTFETTPVKLELREGIRPFHGRAYPVPFIHKHTLKKEVERLESIGVLKWEGASEWGSPTFIIPKKSRQVRFLN